MIIQNAYFIHFYKPEEQIDIALLHPLDRRPVVKVEEVGREHYDQAHQVHLKIKSKLESLDICTKLELERINETLIHYLVSLYHQSVTCMSSTVDSSPPVLSQYLIFLRRR